MQIYLFALITCATASGLYSAADCDLPSSASEQSKFWGSDYSANPSFDLTLVSPECLEKLLELGEKGSPNVKQVIKSALKFSPLLPLATKQYIVSKQMRDEGDISNDLMPNGEDCDKLNFESSSESFIQSLCNNSKCLAGLEDASVASLIKNPHILKYLQLDQLNTKHLNRFVPLVLSNESFLAIQNKCDAEAEDSWCLQVLKALDETKMTESFSDVLNAKINQSIPYEYEGQSCSQSNMMKGGSFDRRNCKKISSRCYHHVTKEFDAKSFAEITDKCHVHLKSIKIRVDTIQLALNTRCVAVIAKFLTSSSKTTHRQYDLSKACGDILANLEKLYTYDITDVQAMTLTRNPDFKSIKNLSIFKPDIIKLLIPFMTFEQVESTDRNFLWASDQDKSASVFLNDQVRDAFALKVHSIQPGNNKKETINSKNESAGENGDRADKGSGVADKVPSNGDPFKGQPSAMKTDSKASRLASSFGICFCFLVSLF